MKNMHSFSFGLVRTLLALSTLTTLVFNDTGILFCEGVNVDPPVCRSIGGSSLYCIFPLELARWGSILALLVVAAGWRPRFTCLAHWWISFSLNNSALIVDGGDQVCAVLSLLIIPICLTDQRKWHWNTSELQTRDVTQALCASTLTLCRLQVSVIYFIAAIEKFKVEEWLNGTALYYWFSSPYMGANDLFRIFLLPIATSPVIAPALNWAVLAFELCLSSLLVAPQAVRLKFVMPAIAFHFLIAITHGLFSFLFAMAAAVCLYLIPVDYSKTELLAVMKRTKG